MAANDSEGPEMTEEERIAAMEKALAIKPESAEEAAPTGSGSPPFFQLALIVAVVLPIAWGIGASRIKRPTAVPVASAPAEPTESESSKSKPSPPRPLVDRSVVDASFRAGNFEAALYHYRSLGSEEILRLPKELLFRIAICQEGLGLWDEALAGLRAVADGADHPNLPAAATLGQARIWLRLHQPDRAVPLLKSLALHPDLPMKTRRELAFLGPLAAAFELSETRATETHAAADHAEYVVSIRHAHGHEHPLKKAASSLNEFNPVGDTLEWPLTTALDDLEPTHHLATAPLHRATPGTDPHANLLAPHDGTIAPSAGIHCTPEVTEDSLPLKLEERLVTAVSHDTSVATVLESVAKQCGLTLDWQGDSREQARARIIDISVEALPVCWFLTVLCDDLHVVWSASDSTLTIARPIDRVPPARVMIARTLVSLVALMPEQRLAPHARFAVGRLARVDGHFDEAAKQYGLLVGRSSSPLAMRAAYNCAECCFRLGDLRRAGDQLEHIVHGAPGHELHARATIWRGRCLLDRGEFREAAFQLQRAAGGRSAPHEQAYASVFLAMAQLMQEQPRAAADALFNEKPHFENDAIRNAAAFLTASARFHQQTGLQQQREAAFLYRALVSLESDCEWLGPTGQLLIGRALIELGIGERAVTLYEQALARHPPLTIAHEMKFAIAEQQLRDQPSGTAKLVWEKLADSGAGVWQHKARLRLAQLTLADGAWKACLTHCRALSDATGVSRQETLQLMGRAYELSGDDSLAAECYAGRLPQP